MKEFIDEVLFNGAQKANVSLTTKQINLFKTYLTEIRKWSAKINITTIRNDPEILIKHFVDSLFPLEYIPQDASVLDVGSGGGFPGIPLKIASPSLYLTLLDSTQKKVNFQKHIIRLLRLYNIEAVHGRAEDKDIHRRIASPFDVVISRAFSGLGRFLSTGKPYLKREGLLIAMRGRYGKRQLADDAEVLVRLRLRLVNAVEFSLPYLNDRRTLLIFTNQ